MTTIVADVDEFDKKNFYDFCESDGMNASTAINIFIKAVLRENCIPFSIARTPDPFYSPANQAYVLKSVQELREGKGQPHDLIEA